MCLRISSRSQICIVLHYLHYLLWLGKHRHRWFFHSFATQGCRPRHYMSLTIRRPSWHVLKPWREKHGPSGMGVPMGCMQLVQRGRGKKLRERRERRERESSMAVHTGCGARPTENKCKSAQIPLESLSSRRCYWGHGNSLLVLLDRPQDLLFKARLCDWPRQIGRIRKEKYGCNTLDAEPHAVVSS